MIAIAVSTNYPWYNSITPVNYWLNGHIKEGKKHFNVSKWASYSVKKKDHKLEELIEELEAQDMPLASYTWTHKEAQLDGCSSAIFSGLGAQRKIQLQP